MNGRSAEDIGVSDEFIEDLLRRGTYSCFVFKYSADFYTYNM